MLDKHYDILRIIYKKTKSCFQVHSNVLWTSNVVYNITGAEIEFHMNLVRKDRENWWQISSSRSNHLDRVHRPILSDWRKNHLIQFWNDLRSPKECPCFNCDNVRWLFRVKKFHFSKRTKWINGEEEGNCQYVVCAQVLVELFEASKVNPSR